MPQTSLVRGLRFNPASGANPALLGFIQFETDLFILDGIALHLTASGDYSLSFPKRVDRAGASHPYMRPAHPAVRTALTDAIVQELRARGILP